MNHKQVAILSVLILSILISCRNAANNEVNLRDKSKSISKEDDDSECSIDDGTHSARIDYYNPSTGYSADYTLNVEVENCQVIQIDFNNGGYLDGDHIDPADIDKNGDASIEDDKGRSFEIHIQD